MHFPIVLIHFQPLKREKPLYKGKNSWSQRVLYSEVPVYMYSGTFSMDKLSEIQVL